MLNKMKRTLAPPVFEDENKSDLARLLHPVVLALFGATFLFALGIGLLNIFTDAHNRELASVVSAVMSILFGGALVWMRRGHLRMVSVLLTIMLFAGTTWAAYNFHGYRDASATGYFVLIAVAGLLFGGKVTVFYTVVSILTLSGMAYAEVSGYKSFPQPKNQFIQLILLSFNLGMTTVVTRLSTWRHRKALARSLQEIAERKRAEEALREGEERYRSLVEISPDAITVTDLNGKLIMTNQRAAELHGFEGVEELLMQDAFELIALEDRQRAMENVRKTLETGGIRNIEYTLLKKDGTTFTADLSASVIVNAEGKPTAFIGVVRDITDRKLAEEMMIQSEKMLTVGRLAAGMAHEINNPLAGILQNAQVMRNRLTGELPKNQSAAEACGTTVEVIEAYMNQRGIFSMIEAINESGRRAAQIVNNVLSFSRKSESRFIPHDLCELLDRTLELASNDYDLRKEYYFRQIEIVREYDAAVPEIRVRPARSSRSSSTY